MAMPSSLIPQPLDVEGIKINMPVFTSNLGQILGYFSSLHPLMEEIQNRLDSVRGFDVCSRWAAESLLQYSRDAKEVSRKLEDFRLWLNKPAREHQSRINDQVRRFTDLLEETTSTVQHKIEQFDAKIKADQQKAEHEALAMAIDMDLNEVPYIAQAAPIRSEAATVYKKKSLVFKVVDQSQVPSEYLMVDSDKVQASIKAGIRNIPGIEISEVEKTIIKSRY